MYIKKVVDLRPSDGSSHAIGLALQEAADELAKAKAALAELEKSRGPVMIQGTAEEIEANEEAMRTIKSGIANIEIFMEALAPQFHVAKRDERIAGLRARYAELDAAAGVQAWAGEWRDTYPALAAQIASMLDRESQLCDAVRQANALRDQLALEGVELSYIQSPAQVAVGGIIAGGHTSFGTMIRLPGVLGAPNLPIETRTVEHQITVERHDWDAVNGGAPFAPGEHRPMRGMDKTGAPLAKKLVRETVRETVSKPAREDTPFWWPRGT